MAWDDEEDTTTYLVVMDQHGRNPHAAAHYGMYVFKPTPLLSGSLPRHRGLSGSAHSRTSSSSGPLTIAPGFCNSVAFPHPG